MQHIDLPQNDEFEEVKYKQEMHGAKTGNDITLRAKVNG